MARRHIISSKEVLDHFEGALNGLTFAKATAKLETRGIKVAGRVTNAKIQEAAQSLLAAFFNDVGNLWVGDSLENSIIQDARDFPEDVDPGPHVRKVKAKYFFK